MSQEKTTWTIDAMRRWTTDYFKKSGIDTPQLDADILLADTLGVERIQLLINGNQELNDDTLAQFKQRVIRRAKKREPIAYILGKKDFWSLEFKVTPNTLIPRPDTECLVEAVLNAIQDRQKAELAKSETECDDQLSQSLADTTNDSSITYESVPDERLASYVEIWAEQDKAPEPSDDENTEDHAIPERDDDGKPIATRDIFDDIDKPDVAAQTIVDSQNADETPVDQNALNIVDIGTGSGAIAIALASELGRSANMTAVDISIDALNVAKENAKTLGFDSIHFVQSDLMDKLDQKFDIVVSNPPYVTENEYNAVEPEVKCEPKLALTAGADGLDIYKRLIPQAFSKLNNRGILAVEIGFKQGDDVKKLFEDLGFKNVVIKNDYAENPRIVMGWKL